MRLVRFAASYEQEELRWFFKEYQRMMHVQVEVKEIAGVECARKVIKRCMEKCAEICFQVISNMKLTVGCRHSC
jgi:hypothetical protein